jgi:hypothetical protein
MVRQKVGAFDRIKKKRQENLEALKEAVEDIGGLNVLESIKSFFSKAFKWVQALWDKHDDHLQEMVANILPMVIEVTFERNDLKGDEKRKAIVDAILDGAEKEGREIATSMINEAVEIAANRYNIQLGRITTDKMDNAVDAVAKAARDFTDGTLRLDGTEAEDAGLDISADTTDAE